VWSSLVCAGCPNFPHPGYPFVTTTPVVVTTTPLLLPVHVSAVSVAAARADGAHSPFYLTSHLPTGCPMLSQAHPLRLRD
jgi:hypothetical protein